MAEGKSLQSLGEEFSTDVSTEFTEEEEETRKTVINDFFQKNDIRLENYIDDYESIDKVGESRVTEQADLVLKTRRVIKQVAGKAEREYDDGELSEKWVRKAEEMHELAKSHPDCAGLYRDDFEDRENPTLRELVDKSTTMGVPKDALERVIYDIGDLLMEYTDWFFEGTEITTEGNTGDSETVEGA